MGSGIEPSSTRALPHAASASQSAERARAVFEQRLAQVHQQIVAARAAIDDLRELAVTGGEPALRAIERELEDVELPMSRLARRLALSPDRVEMLWSIVACSVDGRLVPHLETLGGAHGRRGLSASVHAMIARPGDPSIVELAHWLASPNALVDTGLLVVTEPASPAARAYVASSRLVSFLAGEPHDIEPLRLLRAPADLLLDAAQTTAVEQMWEVFQRGGSPALVIEGPEGSGRATAAAYASQQGLVVLDIARLAPSQLEAGLLALRRECLLRPDLPVIGNADRVLGDDAHEQRRMIGALIDRIDGPLIVTATAPGADVGTERALVRIAWRTAGTEVRTSLWRSALASRGAAIEGDLVGLAHRYCVGPAAIQRAVASVVAARPAGAPIDETALIAGLRQNIAEQLGGLAQRIEVHQRWDDLVISEDTADMIAALVGRVRHAQQVLDRWGYRAKIARGAGVAALFSGPPGTGKTMVAGLIARELGLELYQVDLSKIVSKWIGETEKNLSRIFDAAEQGHALLLFDEADSLFGQRSAETRGASDRYANLEVNYLLQRVEAFGGITVLTTNMESAIDGALKRRLAAHIVFAAPDEDERALLWKRQITTGSAPIARDVDPHALARGFPSMTGANIRNAALSAAFLAAAAGARSIAHEHLVRAARAEYRSMGHMVSEVMTPRSRTPQGR